MKDSILPGLRPLRERLGFTQAKLAEAAGSSGEAICNIENGSRGASLKLVRALAEVLCCTPNDLMESPSDEQLLASEIAFKTRELDRLQASQVKAVGL